MLRAFVVAGLAASTNAIRATHRTAPLTVRGGADDARATHACAAALAAAKGKAAPKIARWRLDVDDGRLCPKGWSAEASSLVEDDLREFDAATRTHWQSEDRVKSRASLADPGARPKSCALLTATAQGSAAAVDDRSCGSLGPAPISKSGAWRTVNLCVCRPNSDFETAQC